MALPLPVSIYRETECLGIAGFSRIPGWYRYFIFISAYYTHLDKHLTLTRSKFGQVHATKLKEMHLKCKIFRDVFV